MNALTAISTSLAKSFVFSGRASRAEFWWFQALRVAVAFAFCVVLSLMFAAVAMKMDQGDDTPPMSLLNNLPYGTALVVFGAAILLLLPASYSSAVRRLHDRGHPGWPLWTVLIAGFFNAYLYLFALVYMLLFPAQGLALAEATFAYFETTFVDEQSITGFFKSAPIAILISMISIGIVIAPFYFIFFSIQACLPSEPGENRHGPVPNTPALDEVFQ